MFMIVIRARVIAAIHRWLPGVFAMFQPMLLKAGMSATGSVAHTEATVRTPAKR